MMVSVGGLFLVWALLTVLDSIADFGDDDEEE